MKKLLLCFLLMLCVKLFANEKPNILWLTSEDNNIRWIGCYGSDQAKTPVIDGLAKEGFLYSHCFASAPVCAPSRSTWITGVNAVAMGTEHMRSRNNIPHNKIKYYPDIFKANGYMCFNHTKTDYNIGGRSDKAAWDGNGKYGWRIAVKKGKPFFQVVNFNNSHESRLHGGGPDKRFPVDEMKIAKHHPDLPEFRAKYSQYFGCLNKIDTEMGAVIAQLKKDGLYEKTIIIYNSDHGGVLPRGKRFLTDTGIHCPLVIRIPEKFKHLYPAAKTGSVVDRIVSYVDMPKTWLSIAGIKAPNYMQGKIFLGKAKEAEPKFHHAFRARMDERYDMVRAVRGKRYLYIRNYMPKTPRGQKLNYLWKTSSMQAWDKLHKEGKTDKNSRQFFDFKASEELYDTHKDPDNVNNLAENPELKEVLQEMRMSLGSWQKEISDAGFLPEAMRMQRAKENKTTIYEMVKNPELYPQAKYMAAAELAHSKNTDLEAIKINLKAKDEGLRYWGIMACVAIGDKAKALIPELKECLKDKFQENSSSAAWALGRLGELDSTLETFRNNLLNPQSDENLMWTLNVIDRLGKPAKLLMPEVRKSSGKAKYIERLKEELESQK